MSYATFHHALDKHLRNGDDLGEAFEKALVDVKQKQRKEQTMTIESLWSGLEKGIVPANASKAYRDDMKRAFFSGAFAMMNVMDAIGQIEDDERADREVGMILAELNSFFKQGGIDPKGN